MMFSSEPILTFANRFEPTDQSALSNRAYLSGRGVRKFFTLETPVKPTGHKTREWSRVSVARDVAWCTHQRTISPHRSPPRNHHVLGVVRDRRPVDFLREEAAEAIHDPSWSRVGREESRRASSASCLPWSWSTGGAGSAIGGAASPARLQRALSKRMARAPLPPSASWYPYPRNAQWATLEHRSIGPSVSSS